MTDPSRNIADIVDVFRGLETLSSEDIIRKCHVGEYTKGCQILSENDQSSDVFFVLRGAVLAQSFSPEGKEVTYACIGQGGIFGEFSAIDGQPRSASIETAEPATIARMSAADFRGLIMQSPQFAIRIAEHLVRKTRELTHRVFEYGTLSVRQRVQTELLRLCEEKNTSQGACVVEPAPTHYEIATRIATHREAVSKELSFLSSRDIVQIGRRSIIVNDVQTLKDMLES